MADALHAAAVAFGRKSGEVRRRNSDALRRIVAATRQAQGLPPTVEDAQVLDMIVTQLEQAARKAPDPLEAA